MSKRCWCGSRRAFSSCCEPYLKGNKLAPTAEALMRSRYSAFCTGHADYLIATHHPSKQNRNEREQLHRNIKSTQWINLLVIKTLKGQKKDKTGRVEFVAAYQLIPSHLVTATSEQTAQSPDAISQLHENSRFVREQGQWLYLDGDILPTYQPKRSHPCWCGSGKPYKHCHFPN